MNDRKRFLIYLNTKDKSGDKNLIEVNSFKEVVDFIENFKSDENSRVRILDWKDTWIERQQSWIFRVYLNIDQFKNEYVGIRE